MKHAVRLLLLLQLLLAPQLGSFARGSNRIVNVNNKKEFIEAIRFSDVTLNVKGVVDLQGMSLFLPKSCNLILSKGKIINGVLKGNETN